MPALGCEAGCPKGVPPKELLPLPKGSSSVASHRNAQASTEAELQMIVCIVLRNRAETAARAMHSRYNSHSYDKI